MEKLTELIEYFQGMDSFDNMVRYSKHHSEVRQRDPAHCYFVGLIADYLIETLNLDLDYKKVRQLIDHHDQCELGWKNDFEAEYIAIDAKYAAEKDLVERRNIEKQAQRYNNPKMKALWEEYAKGETREAKFVRAVDKIESSNHKLARHLSKIGKFTATHPNDFIKEFTELMPFWQEFQNYMAKKYTERGIEWKEEYNIENEENNGNEKSSV
jgi:5'-deoxynucleotidase YfbR-like HD superfamily hydrolase